MIRNKLKSSLSYFVEKALGDRDDLDIQEKKRLAILCGCSVQSVSRVILKTNRPDSHHNQRVKGQVDTQNKRAKKRGAYGKLTIDEWTSTCKKYGEKCLCCGSQEFLVIDHVVPLSKGGHNTIDNIQPLCRTCNLKKHNSFTDYRIP